MEARKSSSSNETGLSAGNVLNESMKPQEKKEESKNAITTLDNTKFTFNICRKYKISICKPLIPLKLALFCFYGGGSAMHVFLTVFYKQRGLTLAELSTTYIISPVTQILGPTLSGIIADKLGRSKPVLVANMLITMSIVSCMLLMPRMNVVNCEPYEVNLTCNNQGFETMLMPNCFSRKQGVELKSCNVHCKEEFTENCNRRNVSCDFLTEYKSKVNFTLTIGGSVTHVGYDECFHNVSSISFENSSDLPCSELKKTSCHISCFLVHGDECSSEKFERSTLLTVNMILLLLYFTTLSNCYRFMDVTCMELIKLHESDFGFQRFFSISGILVFSPLSGFIVSLATPEGAEKNYAAAFYLFMATNFLTFIAISKLDVVIKSPGKAMWKKAWNLLRNPDNIAFIMILFVLGSEWGYANSFRFWYLEDLGGTSLLLGLTSSLSSLYGLPFLLTAKWWVRKIGTTWIFVLACIGYTLNGIGYSLLQDPWLALLCEVSTILTYHLLWVAVIIHSHNIAPEGIVATVISSSGAIHYSIGKSTGSLIGGLIMSAFGGRTAYRVMAAICLVSAALYSVYLSIRRMYFSKKKDLCSKNGKEDSAKENQQTSNGTYTLQNKM